MTDSAVAVSRLTGAGPVNRNLSAELAALVPPGVVTVTFTVPAFSAGATAVSLVAETAATLAARTAPKYTALAPPRLVPVTVTLVWPVTGPLAGVTLVTVGGGT